MRNPQRKQANVGERDVLRQTRDFVAIPRRGRFGFGGVRVPQESWIVSESIGVTVCGRRGRRGRRERRRERGKGRRLTAGNRQRGDNLYRSRISIVRWSITIRGRCSHLARGPPWAWRRRVETRQCAYGTSWTRFSPSPDRAPIKISFLQTDLRDPCARHHVPSPFLVR